MPTTPGKPGRCRPHGTMAGVHGTIAHKKNRCADKGLRSPTPRMVPELHLALRGSLQPTRDHPRSSAITCPEEDKARRRRSAPPGEGRSEKRMGKRTPAMHFSPRFSSDFRVESGMKSSPFGREFSPFSASFLVGESGKRATHRTRLDRESTCRSAEKPSRAARIRLRP